MNKQGLRSTKEIKEEEEFNFPSKIYGKHKIVTVTMQVLNTEELLHITPIQRDGFHSNQEEESSTLHSFSISKQIIFE